MNKTQRLFEISLRPTEAPPPALVEADVRPHIQAIGELINALLTQLDLLQYEPTYTDDVPGLNLREEVPRGSGNVVDVGLGDVYDFRHMTILLHLVLPHINEPQIKIL